MNAHQQRIETMVASGKVTPEEGEALLTALDEPPRLTLKNILLDPVEHLSTASALTVGLLVAAASVGCAVGLGVRFDGALDVHVGGEVSLSVALVDQLLAFPFTALLGWGAARVAGGRARLVDVVAAVGLARAPLLASAPLSALLAPTIPEGATVAELEALTTGPAALRLVALALLTLPLVVWFFVLALRGFRTASGLTGGRAWATGAAWLLVAEVVTKLLLAALA